MFGKYSSKTFPRNNGQSRFDGYKISFKNKTPGCNALATNDALGISAKNIGTMLNTKNIYFVPLKQDDFKNKPNSMIADFDLIPQTLELALESKQIQPIFK